MNILVCKNVTALLRDEPKLNAFWQLCENFGGTLTRTYLNN